MLQEVQALVSEFSSVQGTFFYREANGVADLLAKNAAVTQGVFALYRAAPDFLFSALCHDQRGTLLPRFVKTYHSCTPFNLI
ncbi:hypothetical protein RHGRI_010488 [Rhododendron griersonianum]|uniref:RNase H type-1 domain-containing protein n=1 Tax=Rhododendron griersonianum TaxID=479676 RepID=A0AAV6KJD2_9ERIC|nr:hypothetical protein RHGRI_010488 [Rhododendron griersonianum]